LKSTGELFKHALRQISVPANSLKHIGDNYAADYKGARRAGIQALLYTRAHLNRFEEMIVRRLPSTSWKERSLVAVSKLTRLSREQGNADSGVWDLLSSTIAPFVAGYALWLIEQAEERGITKLFFLARDMQIVHRVAQLLAEKRGSSVECIYVHASRSSWQPAGYSGASEADMFWLTDKLRLDQIEEAISRLMGPHQPADLSSLLRAAKENQAGSEASLQELLQTEPLRSSVKEATSEARSNLLAYLRAAGYAPGCTCALVDAGWRGTLQNSLAAAYQNEKSVHEIMAFYIGTRDVGNVGANCTMITYLSKAIVDSHGYSLVVLLEGMLTADHGSTLGFTSGTNGVEPVLGPAPTSGMLIRHRLVADSCLEYAAALTKSPAWMSTSSLSIESLTRPFLELCSRPKPGEAILFTNWLFDEGRGHVSLQQLARRLTMKDVSKLIWAAASGQRITSVYLSGRWLYGSIAVSRLPFRALGNFLVSLINSRREAVSRE
jgi:hypothetical protein